ncbi:MAG: M42 family metallopeptidase [Ardenticatenaceae bacterium]|nr:M42 family metallopeptidase [Ardenticatenaceae bacterium]
MDLTLLGRLSAAAGIPSREERVRAIVHEAISGVVDETRIDALGNLIAVKHAASATAPRERIMVAAHMDEIGFLVRHIDEQGFLRVHNTGGFDTRNLFARHVLVWTRDGDLPGILYPGTKPVHIANEEERKKIPEIKEFFVDLGLPAGEVQARVRVGDPVTLIQELRPVGNLVSGKDMDDRVAVFVLIETLKALRDRPLPHDLYAVFTTQEEVGLRGAQTSAFGVEPTLGVALDTTLAVDIPGTPAEEAVSRLGEGVGIKVMDSASISTRWLVDEFIALAERRAIPYQLEVLPLGGTDASAIQRSRAGVPAITLSVPTRYIHTVVEACHTADIQATIDLLVAFLTTASHVSDHR